MVPKSLQSSWFGSSLFEIPNKPGTQKQMLAGVVEPAAFGFTNSSVHVFSAHQDAVLGKEPA